MRLAAFTLTLTSLLRDAVAGLSDDAREERGDVPGWVMITLMSALIVAGLLALALPLLEGLLADALNRNTITGGR